ncbi:hypothetical protein [Silvanigrella aquatica]|uniref:Uncharacterized protein n=1 Tax=Silvanigrella aquatica TaxID=1915309 RepID=A0A1L4D010_9BACT|nr:hypothetical protein [Silvanigrella aquatica]APJ03534.1 hypothetical protein AXG55_06290 [Silvanigrella aquatica]
MYSLNKRISIIVCMLLLIIGCNKNIEITAGNNSIGNIIFKEVNVAVINGTKLIQSNKMADNNSYTQMKINMQCNSVYPDGTNLTQTDIVVLSTTNTFDLVKGKTCQIFLKEIIIGGVIFSSVNSNMLNLTISPTIMSPNSSALAYVDSNNNQYYIAANADGTQINIQYATLQADAENIPKNIIQSNPVTVAVSGVSVPVLSNLNLFGLASINGSSPTLTLYGSANGFTSCKIILSSSLTTPISANWSIVDTIYKAATVDNKNVFDCTNFVYGMVNNFVQYANNSWAMIYENHLTNNLLSSYAYKNLNTNLDKKYSFSLDTSFGNNGFFSKDFPTSGMMNNTITLNSNNEPIISAIYSVGKKGTFEFGKLDLSNPQSSSIKNVTQLGIQNYDMNVMTHITLSDNSTIIAYAYYFPALYLVKYKASGEIDTSFGIQGTVTYPLDKQYILTLNMKKMANDNFIVQIGSYNGAIDSTLKGFYIKFLANGNVDSTFGSSGIAKTIVLPFANSMINNFIILKDSSLANISYTNLNKNQLIITKTKADGSIDTSFANNGIYTENLTLPMSVDNKFYSTDIAEGPNSSLFYFINSDKCAYISKLNKLGSYDAAYKTNIQNSYICDDDNYYFFSIKSLSDGTLYGVGGAVKINKMSVMVAKIKPDGNFDQAFAENGIYFDNIVNKNEYGFDFEFTNDNKIYVIGMDFISNKLLVSKYKL